MAFSAFTLKADILDSTDTVVDTVTVGQVSGATSTVWRLDEFRYEVDTSGFGGTPPYYFRVRLDVDSTLIDISFDSIENPFALIQKEFGGAAKVGLVPGVATSTGKFLKDDGSWDAPAGGGVSDHGALTGLGDDDHTQYHNDTRGDARYYTKTEADNKYITGVTAGAGISGGGTVGGISVALDLGELSIGGTLVGTDYLIAENGGADTRQLISSIPLSIFDNDIGAGSGLDETADETISGSWTFTGFANFDAPPEIKQHTPGGAPATGYGRIYPTSDGELSFQWQSDGVSQIPFVQSAVKTAQESVASSTTLQNDDDLLVALRADAWYEVEMLLRVSFTTNSAGGFKFAFDFSNTPQENFLTGDIVTLQTPSTSGPDIVLASSMTTTFSIADADAWDLIATNMVRVKGLVHANATTGGTMRLQWAQHTSSANATLLLPGCLLSARRIFP